LDCVKKGEDLTCVTGVGYGVKNGAFICNEHRSPILNLDSIPYPDFDGFEFGKYLDNLRPSDQFFYDIFDSPRVYPIICSRSCPFLCTFCFHPIGDVYRQRSIDSIMRELELMVKRYRINIVSIYDELLTNNREWLLNFCQRLKEFFRGLPYECKWTCQMRVDRVDDEILRMMKDAGCYLVSYGFESFSTTILKSMKKNITQNQIQKAVRITLKNKISLQANFIFGDVAETRETANETLNFWKQNQEAGIMLIFVNPYPGSEIYRKCVDRGIIRNKLDFIANRIFDNFNMTETMSDNEFDKLKLDIFEARLKYKFYTRTVSLKSNGSGSFSIRIKCPQCKETIEYNDFFIRFKFYFALPMYCRSCRRRFFMVSAPNRIILRFLLVYFAVTPVRVKVILFKISKQISKSKYFFKKILLKLIYKT
jgi:radical SAM superfamily enzyme YgiQ (UPF0313 family)